MVCGVVMPISPMKDRTAEHWGEVLAIITEAVEKRGYTARLVSDSSVSSVIQGRIVGNLYHDPVVVVDVSAHNANVMFELGLRLAFDKPTVIIKDTETDYKFDIGPLEHLSYPLSLNYAKILKFKEDLADKVETAASRTSKTYLEHFGPYQVASIEVEKASRDDLIMQEVRALRSFIANSQQLRTRRVNVNVRAFIHESVLLAIKEMPSDSDDDAVMEFVLGNLDDHGFRLTLDDMKYLRHSVHRARVGHALRDKTKSDK